MAIDLNVPKKAWRHTMRAIHSSRREGLIYAWLMARASYEYSRSHGLSIRESLAGAWELFRESV